MAQYFTFTPTLNGSPVNLGATGGTVDYLNFYESPTARSDQSTPYLQVSSAIPLGDGTWRFQLPDVLPDGRYWLAATWRTTLLDDPTFQALDTIDYPIIDPPLVRPEDVAPLLGLTLPIGATERSQLAECVADAESVVELAIGSFKPVKLVLTNAAYDETSELDRNLASTWFYDTTNITIDSWSANFDGTYNVTYWYGFDGRKERPIKRFIVRYAAAWWRKAFGGDNTFGQTVSSISTEGQSVSYSSKERATDVDPSLGMSLEALVKRYGSAATGDRVGVFQRRNQSYGAEQTFWPGDGYEWPNSWWW